MVTSLQTATASSTTKLPADQALTWAMGNYPEVRLVTGHTLLQHVQAIADILRPLKLDRETLQATFLRFSLRYRPEGLSELRRAFTSGVCDMIADLDRIPEIDPLHHDPSGKPRDSENLLRFLLGIAKDIRVLLIIIAERLNILRHIKECANATQQAIARDTLSIHAPLANRLGIGQLKWELEDLSLRYLEPDQYHEIAAQLASKRSERELYIEEAVERIRHELRNADIDADISGRPKHIYSIWKKMRRKKISFEQVFDVLAIRILVPEVEDCYAALSVVHNLWEQIPGEFDDYITIPKSNMYQSLHTALVGPQGKPLEVQIRTYDMHHHAELGVAAHWRYKEQAGHDSDFQRRINWIRHWLQMKQEHADQDQFYRSLADELQPEHIYVFTPQDNVIELEAGATALDFAYAIHTEIGHRCRGAKADGQIIPLTQPLTSGQRVEVLTGKQPQPSRDWLHPQSGYLKTSRARYRVRQWFKQLDFSRHAQEGKQLLERHIGSQRLSHPDWKSMAADFHYRSADELFAAVGRHDLNPLQVCRNLTPAHPPGHNEPETAIPRARTSRPGDTVFLVESEPDLLARPAQCCKPIPHDTITGFITKGRGISVHRNNCPNLTSLLAAHPERIIGVDWNLQSTPASFAVDLRILASDREDLLRDLLLILSQHKANITSVQTHSDKNSGVAAINITLEMPDRTRFERLLRQISQTPGILQASRL